MSNEKKLGGEPTSDRSNTGGMADEARREAAQLSEEAGNQVTSQLNEQKDRASEQLGTVSSALRSTSDDLRQDDEAMVANYMDGAAHQVDRLSSYMRNNSISDMYSEAERYARREPSIFIGGALLAGFLGARFLKSSSPEHRRSYRPRSGSMTQSHRDERRTYREGPSSDRSRSQVHGTAGAEMPDTVRSSSASSRSEGQESSASSSSPGNVPSARRQTPNMPHEATSKSSQQAAPRMPETSADDSEDTEVS